MMMQKFCGAQGNKKVNYCGWKDNHQNIPVAISNYLTVPSYTFLEQIVRYWNKKKIVSGQI